MLSLNKRMPSRGEKGFSFIELVIVIAVIGILVSLLIPAYGSIQKNARQGAVDTAADTGYKLVFSVLNGFTAQAAATTVGELKTPRATLDTVENERIQAEFIDLEGNILSQPGSDYCVWAYNTTAIGPERTAEYQGLAGHCPDPEEVAIIVPDSEGNQTPGTDTPTNPGGNNGAGEGDTDGGGGSTNPGATPGGGDNGPQEVTAHYTLRCDSNTTWKPNLVGFTGTQLWSDDTKVAGLGTKRLIAGETYEVEFQGKYASTSQMTYTEASCLRRVDSWGENSGATSLAHGAERAVNLEYVAAPPASVRNLSYLLAETRYNEDVSSWNTSNVTNMANLFSANTNFNQPVNSWDTSSVTDMSRIFNGAWSFNQPLDQWDTSNVRDFTRAFSAAKAFNQNIDSWDVSGATTLGFMFAEAEAFNQPLNSWDVSNVENLHSTFAMAHTFNQPLDQWDVGNVTTMNSTFNRAFEFNQNVAGWDVSKVTDFSGTFSWMRHFNQPLGSWDTGSAQHMTDMFRGATPFDQDLSGWDVHDVRTSVADFARYTPMWTKRHQWPAFQAPLVTRDDCLNCPW